MASRHIKVFFDRESPLTIIEKGEIHIPPVPEKLTAEVYKLIRTHLDHESARVMYTNPVVGAVLDDPITKAIYESIEDGRINKCLGDELYGCKIDLEEGRPVILEQVKARNLALEAMGAKISGVTRAMLALSYLAEGCNRDEALKWSLGAEEPLTNEILDEIEDVVRQLPGIKSSADAASAASLIHERWKRFLAPPPPPPPSGGKGKPSKDKKAGKDGKKDSEAKKHEDEQDPKEDKASPDERSPEKNKAMKKGAQEGKEPSSGEEKKPQPKGKKNKSKDSSKKEEAEGDSEGDDGDAPDAGEDRDVPGEGSDAKPEGSDEEEDEGDGEKKKPKASADLPDDTREQPEPGEDSDETSEEPGDTGEERESEDGKPQDKKGDGEDGDEDEEGEDGDEEQGEGDIEQPWAGGQGEGEKSAGSKKAPGKPPADAEPDETREGDSTSDETTDEQDEGDGEEREAGPRKKPAPGKSQPGTEGEDKTENPTGTSGQDEDLVDGDDSEIDNETEVGGRPKAPTREVGGKDDRQLTEGAGGSRQYLPDEPEEESEPEPQASPEDLAKAAETLRRSAENASKMARGRLMGQQVEQKAREARTTARNNTYFAWTERDEIVTVSPYENALTEELFKESRQAVAFLRTRLMLDLLGRGKIWVRDQDQGRLDDRRLHRAAVGDQRIFRRRLPREEIDTAMCLLVDCSGSMAGGNPFLKKKVPAGYRFLMPGEAEKEEGPEKIKLAMMLAMAFCEACEILGVPNEVLAFTTMGGHWLDLDFAKSKSNSFSRWEPLRHMILKPYSKRFAETRHTFANAMCSGLVNNVDGEAVLWAARRLAERRESSLKLIVLSDGWPQAGANPDALRAHLKGVVKRTNKAGIDTIGIGIQSDAVKDFYPEYVVFDNLKQLVTGGYEKVSNLLRKAPSTRHAGA